MQQAYNRSISLASDTGESDGERCHEVPAALSDTLRPSDFCELVPHADPEAANDDCYVDAGDFPEVRDSIAASLVRALLWWAIGVSLIVAAFAAVLR